ncbi:MAG: efflux RND transporter periplasmic adaptor subunit [Atopobiaceae bacterium]
MAENKHVPEDGAPKPLDVLAPGEGLGKTAATTQLPRAEAEEDAEGLAAFAALERVRKEKKHKKRVRTLIICAVIAVAACALILPQVFAAQSTNTVEHVIASVYKGDLISSVTVSGSAQPVSSTVVTPEVDGIIQDVQVSEGDTVNAGDLLFTIKNDSLDRAVTQAQQEAASSQRALDDANAAYDQAYRTYKKALDTWNAAKTAEEQSTMQDPDDVWYSTVVPAASSVDAAKTTLANAQQAVTDAQATADKRRVTAPVSGSVIAVNAQNGASWGAGSATGSASSGPLVQIANLSQLRVTTSVDEMDISSLAIGQNATITFSALPDVTLDGTVERVATASESSDSGYGYGYSSSATYKVSLIIPAPDPRVKPGMTADATIVTQDVPDSLIVPIAALHEADDGTSYVWVLVGDDAAKEESWEKRTVEILAKSADEAAITNVKEGDGVDVSGYDALDSSSSSSPALGESGTAGAVKVSS